MSKTTFRVRGREFFEECCERGEMALTLMKTKRCEKRMNRRLKKLYEKQLKAEEAMKRLSAWANGEDPY